ncbi:MAG: amidohydrolase family protein, partial [Anaerolineae bacterium]
RVFDGERLLPEAAVIVAGGLVEDVLPCNSLPAGLPLVAAPGCTLLPGLIDTHIHFMRWSGPLCLAWGVTTVRDCGSDLAWILARREEARRRPWPRILCLGAFIDGPDPVHPLNAFACATRQEAVAAVEEQAAAGVDGIKLYVGLPNDWLPEIVRAAHCLGLKVSRHCQAGGVLAAARAGVDEFYHLDGILNDVWPAAPAGWLERWGAPGLEDTRARQREVARDLIDSGITATPTLAYYDSQARAYAPGFRIEPRLTLIPGEIITTQTPTDPDEAASALWLRALAGAQRFCGLLQAEGVPFLAGTDIPCGAQLPGLALWRELSLLEGAGLTPLQTLKAATSAAADFLEHPELGRLRAGAAADLVCVRGNPLEGIPDKPDIAWTMRAGLLHTPDELLAEAALLRDDLADEPWQKQFAWHAAH